MRVASRVIAFAALVTVWPGAALSQAWPAIEPNGWELVGSNADQRLFVKPGPAGDGVKRQWSRYERRTPKALLDIFYRSVVALQEFRCAEGKSRTVQFTAYAGNNMTGESRSRPVGADWEFSAPGTFAEHELELACAP